MFSGRSALPPSATFSVATRSGICSAIVLCSPKGGCTTATRTRARQYVQQIRQSRCRIAKGLRDGGFHETSSFWSSAGARNSRSRGTRSAYAPCDCGETSQSLNFVNRGVQNVALRPRCFVSARRQHRLSHIPYHEFRRHHREGCCCVKQCSVPNPHTRSTA